MADPEQDYTPIAIEQTHPIVTQPWTPPYKPAVCPLQNSWKNVMATANVSATTDKKKSGFGGAREDPRGGDFFYSPPSHSPKSAQPHLPGGSSWGGGGGGGGGAAGHGGGGFNAFQFAAGVSKSGGNGQDTNNSNFGSGAVAGSFVLPSGIGRNLSSLDEDDEYDERVNIMKSSMQGRTPIGGGGSTARRKSRAQRDREREEYRRQHETMLAQGYASGGEVDEGCIGAIGDDDEVRDMRLRFTPGAAMEDGTGHTAYASAVAYKRRGNLMRTPPPHSGGGGAAAADGSSSGFRPQGLRTPVYDPTSNLPGPVARHQKRQQHHMLRLLGGAGPSSSTPVAAAAAAHSAGQHLFSPHEIPTGEDESTRRQNRFDDPSLWLFGRDESVEEVMKKHFLKEQEEKGKQQQQQQQPQAQTQTHRHHQQQQSQHNVASPQPENVRTINLRR